MSFLAPDTKTVPEFTGLQVNTAVQALPTPIAYGAPRMSANLIYYNGFKAVQQSVGGKGILSGGKGGTQTEYFATLLMALCEGPINVIEGGGTFFDEIFLVYQDQGVYLGDQFPGLSAIYPGNQVAPDPFILTNWPQDARTYKRIVYLVFEQAQLDSSATVPQMNFIIRSRLTFTCPLNNTILTITQGQTDQNGNPVSFLGQVAMGTSDADPGQVIVDFLTNSQYGAGFPPALLDTSTLLSSAQAYDSLTGDQAISTFCQAVGIGWSTVLNNAESGNSIVDRWCKNMNVAEVWNGAQLRFIPYWDRPASANPGYQTTLGPTSHVNPFNIPLKYFTPYVTPITTITLDHILQPTNKEDDPITFSRKDPQQVFNVIHCDFRDRTNFFNDNVVEAEDPAHIELFSRHVDEISLTNETTLAEYANVVAQQLLRRNISIMKTFEFRLGPLWAFLDPMDLISIPDPANTANFITVRIIECEDDEEGIVTVKCEEFPLGAQSPTFIPVSQTLPPNQGPTNVTPPAVYPPVIFEPTTAMLTATGFGTPQVIVGASGGYGAQPIGQLNPFWGGYNLFVSLNAVDYEFVGKQTNASTIGVTTTGLPAYGGSNPDPTDTVTVDLDISNGTLNSTSAVGAANGARLSILVDASGFELLSFTTATFVGGASWRLSGLYRGLYGTTPREFGAGSQFLYVGTDANFFQAAMPPQYVGHNFFVKLQSFNIFNHATQDLADCVAYEYKVIGPTPLAPVAPPTNAPYGTQRGVIQAQSPLAVAHAQRAAFTTPP